MFCKKCKKELIAGAAYCSYCGTAQNKKPRVKRNRGNGEGTVYWDKTSYCAEKTFGYKTLPNGKVQRVYSRKWSFKTKREALEYLSSLTPDQKQNRTLQDLWLSWSKNRLADFAKSTQNAYLRAYSRLEHLTFKKMTDILISDLEDAIAGYSYENAKDIKSLAVKLFDRAMVDHIVTVNLGNHLVLPQNCPGTTQRLTKEEVDRLWADWSAGETFTGYILLMVYTGMMPGELLKLKKPMVNFETQTIMGCGIKTKKRMELPIVFPDFASSIIKKLMTAYEGELLYPYSYTTFIRTFNKLKLRLKINPEATPYSTRRTMGTELGLAGVPPAVIIDLMRHTDYDTTVNYYNLLTSDDRVAAVNKLYNSNPAELSLPSSPPSSRS